MTNGPGKAFRKGMSLIEIIALFPDDDAAGKWFEGVRWGGKPSCPYCGSLDVLTGAKHKTMPFRCREKECRRRFSVRTKSAMEASNIGYQKWAIAFYIFATHLKGVSSMKLHRDLGITQKSAWFMAHRIREAWQADGSMFGGPVEVDETKIGGKFKNMHGRKRHEARQKPDLGKATVAGIRDRQTARVIARVVPNAKRVTLQAFLMGHVAPSALVYHDDAKAYQRIPFAHESVNHSVGEYVRGQVHTNGVESFWAMLKRGIVGTFHHVSPKHLDRYVGEFAGRNNMRPLDTLNQMELISRGMSGRRLRYRELIAG